MENYALHVPGKMIHDSGGKKNVRHIFGSGNKPERYHHTIDTDALIKIPLCCEFDFQQGLDRNNGFGGLEEH